MCNCNKCNLTVTKVVLAVADIYLVSLLRETVSQGVTLGIRVSLSNFSH